MCIVLRVFFGCVFSLPPPTSSVPLPPPSISRHPGQLTVCLSACLSVSRPLSHLQPPALYSGTVQADQTNHTRAIRSAPQHRASKGDTITHLRLQQIPTTTRYHSILGAPGNSPSCAWHFVVLHTATAAASCSSYYEPDHHQPKTTGITTPHCRRQKTVAAGPPFPFESVPDAEPDWPQHAHRGISTFVRSSGHLVLGHRLTENTD